MYRALSRPAGEHNNIHAPPETSGRSPTRHLRRRRRNAVARAPHRRYRRGSIFYITNTAAQPLTAYLIELVNYPGSSYSLWQEEITAQPVPPGAEKRIPVNNMTVGAVPDYVKLQAAIFADGTSSGIPEKVTQLVERRRFLLETTRELLRRLEKPGVPKADLIAGLKQWADSLQPPAKPNRSSQAFINQSAARGMISETVARLDKLSLEDTLASVLTAERALAASKPAL